MPVTAAGSDLSDLTITVSVKQTSARGAVMYQTIGAVAATTVLATAGLVFALVTTAPTVSAQSVAAQSWMPMVAAAAKADSFDDRYYGADCSQQSWPYIAASCLHSTATKVQTIRVIAVDRTQR